MNFLSIATDLNQYHIFDENPTWQHDNVRGIFMVAIRKFWILVTLYLISLWLIWLLTIRVMTKLL